MATAVTIQITVDAAQADAAMKALTKTFAEAEAAGDVAFKRTGEGVKKLGGHTATALDSVRLLSQEFGLRLPRAIEAMLSRIPAVTNAIAGMLGGLAAIAAAQVFVRMAEDGYKLYQQYISLNAEADKFYETLKKTAAEDYSQTRSLESTRRRGDDSTQNVTADKNIAGSLQSYGMASLVQGNWLGALVGIRSANEAAKLGVEASGNMVKLGRVQLDQTHEQALAQINLNHAMDGALVGQQKINAEVAKKKDIDEENRKFDRKVELFYGNVSPADAGAQKQRTEDQQAEAEGRAQSILLGRAAALSLMKTHDEMVQSNLQGDALYLRKFEDIGREMTLSMQNEGKSAEEIHASVLAAQAKLDAEYSAKWMQTWRTTQETMATARVGGLSGAARITADFANQQNRNNSNPELVASGAAHDMNVAAQTEMFQKLKELQENFTDSTLASINERTQADLNGYARIEAEGTKALADLQRSYDKAFKDDQGNDLGTPAVHAAMAGARSSIEQKTQDDKNRLTLQNNQQDLEYAQQAARAEARVKEDGINGWVAAYKNGIVAIRDQEDQLTARMLEEAQKQGASEQEISQRKIDIHREANAQIAQQDQQLKNQIAGTLQEAFTNPVDFIKSAMEKMFFEILAGWIMKMKSFQAIFGNMLGTVPGGSGSGSLISGALGAAGGLGSSGAVTSSTTASVPGGGSAIATGSSSTASLGSAVGSVGSTISSVSNLAQLTGLTGSSSTSTSPLDFSGSMTGDTPDLTDAQYAAQQGTAADSNLFGYLGAGMGAYQGVTGTMAAFKSGNPLSGALSDAAAGAAIGSVVPGIGTAIGAAAGAAIGAGAGFAGMVDNMGAKIGARDYYNKQVFPALSALAAHPNGDFQSEIAQANSTANGALMYMGTNFGVEAANWVNDNYMKKELKKVDTLLADTASGGRYATTLSAMQFHSGGQITGFGDYATSHNEGMIHAMLGETVMNPAASMEHGSMLAAMNSGASAAEVASRYLAGGSSGAPASSSGSGAGLNLHIHTLDTRTMQNWLKTGGAQLINSHLNDYKSQYAGDGING